MRNRRELVEAVRHRAEDPDRRTDMTDVEKKNLRAVAGPEQLASCESQLGFSLPPPLRRILLEVANGGVGPGYGLIGVVDGDSGDDGEHLSGLYRALATEYEEDGARWPPYLLPVCDWGCGVSSCVDCRRPNGAVVTYSEFGFTDTGESLETWLRSWADGDDIWGRMFEREQREITNPFTGKPVQVSTIVTPIGKPFC